MIKAQLDIHSMKRSILMVVIEPDNLARMMKADPITLEPDREGGVMSPVTYPDNFTVLIAYEDDTKLYTLARSGDLVAMLQYLERGRKWVESEDGPKNTVVLHKADGEKL
jgi:hypothetical protein